MPIRFHSRGIARLVQGVESQRQATGTRAEDVPTRGLSLCCERWINVYAPEAGSDMAALAGTHDSVHGHDISPILLFHVTSKAVRRAKSTYKVRIEVR